MYNNTKPTEVYPPTVKAIVALYLREHGYDGLAGDNCGCSVDGLFPCECGPGDCIAAYRRPATQKDIDEGDYLSIGDMIFSPTKGE